MEEYWVVKCDNSLNRFVQDGETFFNSILNYLDALFKEINGFGLCEVANNR